jgi:hypothetical protein
MSDDPQDSPPVEKEYWHDRRREAARAAGALASSRSDGIRPTREDDSVSAATVVSHFRTSRALRHPIASFLVTVVAVIVLGVCLLAATGGGALGYPPVRLSDCAPANSALLGPRGAEFTAAFPAGRVYVEPAEVLDICGYVHPMKTATSQLFGGFVVTAVYGALSLHGDTYFGYRVTPSWVQPGEEVSSKRIGDRSGPMRRGPQLVSGLASTLAGPSQVGAERRQRRKEPANHRVVLAIVPARTDRSRFERLTL